MSFQIWPRNRVVQQISTWRCSMLSSIIIVVTMLASASESFLISFMLHSPTIIIFFIISPSSLSHSQILTPYVRLPSSKLPNSLNWKISKCWNLQFQNSTISIFNIWTFKIFASGIFPTALIETLENIWTFLNLWELQYQLEYFQTFLNLWKLWFHLEQFQLLRSTI